MNSTSEYYREDGTHGVPIWRIGGFAMNNLATNLYLFFMGYVAYYLSGWVGVSTVLAGSFSMIMRIWDGVTDPLVDLLVNKTDGKFGKNRPFMVIGQLILCITSYILFHVTHILPEIVRFPFFIVVSCVYYLGYTAQSIVTKSGQICLTNDPKQRLIFTIFDAVYNTLLFAMIQVIATNLSVKYGGFLKDVRLYQDLWVITAVLSAICTVVAVISIAPKDKTEFYVTNKNSKVSIKDYLDTLSNNKALQMLIVSASSDKLAFQIRGNVAVMAVLMGVVVGDYAVNGIISSMVAIPTTVFVVLLVGGLSTALGQKKAMLIGSWGSIICQILLIILWVFGDPKTLSNGQGNVRMGYFFVFYLILNVVNGGLSGVAGNMVIPMTADCADYEVYRTGKYIPNLMGTLFSFVDKIVSSFAPMLVAWLYAAIGFTDALPDQNAEYSTALFSVSLFCLYGAPIIGLICNIVALKIYPLTKEKMEEIQEKIAEIKAKANARQLEQ